MDFDLERSSIFKILQQKHILNRKMMESQYQNGARWSRSGSPSGSVKENSVLIAPVTQIPKSPTKIIKSHSIHPDQTQVLYSSQWTTSTGPVTPFRVVSPNSSSSSFHPSKRAEYIELGGSRQKRNSYTKDCSVRQPELVQVQSVNDGYIRKINMLEARIREIHRQKQQAIYELSERSNKLQHENDRLSAIIHNLEVKEKEKEKVLSVVNEEEFDRFNLEDMLSTQINVNLQLRDRIESVQQELQAEKQKTTTLECRLNEAQIEKSQILKGYTEKLNTLVEEKQGYANVIQQLQERIQELSEFNQKREAAIQELIQQKEKRILELEQESYSQASSCETKQKIVSQLQEELSAVRLDHSKAVQQIQSLKQKNTTLQKEDCKKCKEMLNTIFRLNTQLNKK